MKTQEITLKKATFDDLIGTFKNLMEKSNELMQKCDKVQKEKEIIPELLEKICDEVERRKEKEEIARKRKQNKKINDLFYYIISNDTLDRDSLIDYVNKISETV